MSKPNFNKNSSAQGTIESMKGTSIAQGTIEYLIIIAIVVVISLVVVALMLGIFENNSDVSSTAQSIFTQTLPVALNEAILGTGADANGLIVLTNNTGDVIRDVRVVIDGKDHNYFGINVAQGNKITFKLNELEEPCPAGQTSIIKTITIIYTTRTGLEKTQKIENVTLQCTQNQNPQTTTPPKEETQEEEEEIETPEPTPTDTTDPELTNLTSEVDGNTIHLTFRAWDNNDIDTFEINENDGGYQTIEPEYVDDYLDGNYYTIINENLEYETEYTFCIKVTDYNNNSAEDCDTNTTDPEPYIDPCPGQTELYGECYDNVVAYWPMDETSGTTAIDYADFDNNATCTNCPTINQTGKVGRAYYFDGNNDKLTAGQTGIPYGSSDRTLCSWIKIDSDAISQERGIVGYGGESSGQLFHTGIYSQYLRYSGSWNDYWTASKLNPSEWTFVCISYQNSPKSLKFYINGVFDKNQNTLTVNTATTDVSIGYVNLGQMYWKGYLDEVMIFNESLSQSDINEIYYNSGGTQVEQLRTGLVGYWPLDETSGTIVMDYSESNKNGTCTSTYCPTTTTGLINSNSKNFDSSDDYFEISDESYWDNIFNGYNPFSISVWFKNNAAADKFFIKKGNDPYFFGFGFADSGSRLYLFIKRGSDSSSIRVRNTVDSQNIGTWTQFSVTYNGSGSADGVKFYIGNTLQTNNVRNNSLGSQLLTNEPLQLGKMAWGSGSINGALEEVKVWNRVLTEEEIQALYNSGNGLSLIQ